MNMRLYLKGKVLIGFIVLLSILILSNCKKKENNTPPPATNNPPASNTGSYGMLIAKYLYYDNGQSVVNKDSLCNALFYSSPIPGTVVPTNVDAGLVTLNSNSLSLLTGNNYVNTTPINIHSQLIWSVAGSSLVPAFTHTQSPSYPVYSGGNLLPDTCFKASGFTINVSGMSNTTGSVLVTVQQSSNIIVKQLSAANGTVFISTADLANFTSNLDFSTTLSIGNFESPVYSSKKFTFSTAINYRKQMYLKP